jgi:hypothetical protein
MVQRNWKRGRQVAEGEGLRIEIREGRENKCSWVVDLGVGICESVFSLSPPLQGMRLERV